MAASNGAFSEEQYKATEQYPATSGTTEASGQPNGQANPSKDEIGWYFVEQYYTTLSKNPEKLHLFYGKRSQFVSGLEAEVAPVSVGRAAIQERIRSFDYQDCKVRVSNVDSQASDETIVIQVIGETSNKSADLKKFVQTFVLAAQPTGYFVLNDIFRYIKDEVEEEVVDAAAAQEEIAEPEQAVEAAEAPATIPETKETKEDEVVKVVEKKPEEDLAPAVVKNAPIEETAAKVAEVAAPAPAAETPEEVEKAIAEEDIKTPEAPRDPGPTPTLSRITSATPAAPAAPVVPAVAAAPPKPMSWASRAAAAAVAAPRPAVPAPKTASPAPTQVRAPPAPAAAQPAPAATSAPTANKENEAPQSSGWQTAGAEKTRQNRPQSISTPVEKEGVMGYVRNVTEAVKNEELKAALTAYGDLVYFDVNRQKNCAFVEFATPAGYQAAFAANPHQINGESILVEPRRPKSSAYGGVGYSGRGGMNNRGRGGFEQGRTGSPRGGRGDFGGRGRGGAPRGRGPSQPTTA